MTWSVVTGIYSWPDALDTKNNKYGKANKKGELTDLISSVDTAHEQYKKVNWPGALQGKVSTARARSLGQDAIDFFKTGSLPKLRASLQITSKRAGVIAKNSKASKEARAAASSIATAADSIVDFTEGRAVTKAISDAVHDLIEAERKRIIARLGSVFAHFKEVTEKGHPGLWKARAQLQKWPTDPNDEPQALQEIGNALYGDARDMTQNVTNLLKAINEGYDLTEFGVAPAIVKALPGLSKGLVPIANAKAGVATGLSQDAVTKLVSQVARDAAMYDKIADALP